MLTATRPVSAPTPMSVRMRTKLIGAFLIVVVLPLSSTALYGNWVTSRALTGWALEAAQHDLEQRALSVQSYLQGHGNDTLYLAELPTLRALLAARRAGDTASMEHWVRETGADFLRFTTAFSGFNQIRYIAEDGHEWVRLNTLNGTPSLVAGDRLQTKADRYYFQRTVALRPGQVFISGLDLNQEFGAVEIPHRPVIRYATPVFFDDGRPAGIVILNVDAQDMLDLIQGEDGLQTIALADSRGYYLAHPDPSKRWGGPESLAHGYGLDMDYPGLAEEFLSAGEGFLALDSSPGSQLNPWQGVLAWARGVLVGPERLLTYRTILPAVEASDTFWVLLCDKPGTAVFASVLSFRVTAMGILIGAGLMASMMAVIMARRLTAPILALTQGVRWLASGHADAHVSVAGRDEIGELAQAFNEMAEALQRNLERLTLLNQGGQHIAGQIERPDVLKSIIQAVNALVECDCCVVTLTDRFVEQGDVAASAGDQAWLVHRRARSVVAVLQAALDTSTWQAAQLQADTGPEGYLCCAPLCMGLESQGLIEVYGPQESLADPTTGSVLATLANQGSIALEKADLIRQLEDHKTQLESLVEQLIRAQEEERRVVAYDIHDGLVQMLVGVRLHLSNYAAERRPATEQEEAALQLALDQLGATVVEARRLIEGLRPTALDELGLVETLQQYAQDLADAEGWNLEFRASPPALRAPPAMETTAFRVAQEALTNIRKHAATERVRIVLTRQDAELTIEIQDWGRGFDPTAVLVDDRRIGLAGIRERARLLGGSCTIKSEPGQGARIQVTLPLPVEASTSG